MPINNDMVNVGTTAKYNRNATELYLSVLLRYGRPRENI